MSVNEITARELSHEELHELAAKMPSRILGPRALQGSPRRFLSLVWMLAYLEFKLKFFGSVLGYAWQLFKPLLMFGVLFLVFSTLGGFDVKFYGVVLLSGIVLFSFFSESTVGAVTSIVQREGLIRKISFPIMAAPLSTVTSVALTLVLNYLVVLIFGVAVGVTPTIRWIEILPLLGLLYLVSISVGVALSVYYVPFRDVMPIWEVIAQSLFYLTPVIFPIEFIQQRSELAAKLMMCNPVAAIIQQMRHAAIDPSAPSAGTVLGSWWLLLIPLGLVVLLALFGYWSMNRMAPRAAEQL